MLRNRLSLVLFVTLLSCGISLYSQNENEFLRDRGPGIPTSMFGTYIEKGDFIVYPFFEYYHDKDFEYEPSEFGFGSTTEYYSKYTANEGLLYIGYGISKWVSIEIEAAIISGTLEKADNDLSDMPLTIKESGLGDVEGQIRWRYNLETAKKT